MVCKTPARGDVPLKAATKGLPGAIHRATRLTNVSTDRLLMALYIGTMSSSIQLDEGLGTPLLGTCIQWRSDHAIGWPTAKLRKDGEPCTSGAVMQALVEHDELAFDLGPVPQP